MYPYIFTAVTGLTNLYVTRKTVVPYVKAYVRNLFH
jgi:hypothetical protein